ncbi:MAG: RHS repeat domain-containing protein, partial [Terriglobales bacterium]
VCGGGPFVARNVLRQEEWYDALNRLTSLTNFSAQTFTFSYDALGRRTQLTRPNAVNTNYTYDNLSRLLSVLHKLGAQTIDGATYTVDAVGNRTSKLNHINSITENYTYDAIYQLTQVVQGGTTTTEAYSYDKVGNRLSTLADSGWSYNNSNQLASRPGVTYTYDNNGNTLTKTEAGGTTQYAWDYENRLTSVTLPDQSVVSFKYDAAGRRVQKTSASGTTIYLYD